MHSKGDFGHGRHEMFWGEIAPCEHLVQIYTSDGVFLDALEGFVAGGLRAGDGVLIIATPDHRAALAERLEAQGLDVDSARMRDEYIDLDAQETIDHFMVRGWPDEDRFKQVVLDLLARAGSNGRRVRAFGEMVALMWAGGQCGATVRLEHLWHSLCQSEAFSLFCAYPRSGFTQNADASMREICAAHSKVIHG